MIRSPEKHRHTNFSKNYINEFSLQINSECHEKETIYARSVYIEPIIALLLAMYDNLK